jgi:hypothetical protein
MFLYLHYYWSVSLPAETECCPSRAFHAGSGQTEFLFESFKTSELFLQSCAQSSGWLSPAFARWCQISPEQGMEQMSSYVKRKLLQGGFNIEVGTFFASLVQPLEYGIGTIDVRLMMLLVV